MSTAVSRKPRSRPSKPTGVPIDSSGGPTIDPTENVKALNAASEQRRDDLSGAFESYVALLDRRQDDLREMAELYSKERLDLVRGYEKEIREKETQRIDAISAKNDAAVQAAAEVQRAQATLLANQVATTGETLRAQVLTTASAQEQRLVTILEPINKTLESLRQAQYEQQGQKAQQQEYRVDSRAGTQNNQWLIGVIVALGVFVANEISKRVG